MPRDGELNQRLQRAAAAYDRARRLVFDVEELREHSERTPEQESALIDYADVEREQDEYRLKLPTVRRLDLRADNPAGG